jgi:hypothetical protein
VACANSTNDDKFRECAFDVVQSKFPVKTIRSILFDKDTFLDDTGSITDPKVRAVVEDLVQRHATYAGTEKQKSENREAFLKQVKEFQAVKDPGSDAFREKVIMAPRKELFILGLTGIENSATAYLETQHPGQFKKNRKLVENLLAEDDTDKQDQLMNQLRLTGACELSETLDDLLNDRADFLKGRFTPGDRRRRRRSSCGDGGSNFGSSFGNGFGNNSGGFRKPKPINPRSGSSDENDTDVTNPLSPKIKRNDLIERDDTN